MLCSVHIIIIPLHTKDYCLPKYFGGGGVGLLWSSNFWMEYCVCFNVVHNAFITAATKTLFSLQTHLLSIIQLLTAWNIPVSFFLAIFHEEDFHQFWSIRVISILFVLVSSCLQIKLHRRKPSLTLRRRLRGGLGARATPGYCYGGGGGAEPPLRNVQKFALYRFLA